MKSEVEAQNNLKYFITQVEKQFDSKVKIIHSNNGVEFIMRQFYASASILHQNPMLETPQQNAIIERKH